LALSILYYASTALLVFSEKAAPSRWAKWLAAAISQEPTSRCATGDGSRAKQYKMGKAQNMITSE